MFRRYLVAAAISVASFFALAPNAGAVTSGWLVPLANDSFDWSQLGPSVTYLSSPLSVTSATTTNSATVTNAGGDFEVVTQPTWDGNFPAGVSLLGNGAFAAGNDSDPNNGPDITISFTNPVKAAGAQIQAVYYGDFVAEITAYDASSNLLGSFSLLGNSNDFPDTAIFIGILSDASNISKIVFDLLSAESFPNEFAIGTLQTYADVTSTTTPLPAALPLFAGGLSLLGWAAARRRKPASR